MTCRLARTATVPPPAPAVVIRFPLTRKDAPLLAEVRDWQRGELLEKDTIPAIAHWLDARGYVWRAGVWEAA